MKPGSILARILSKKQCYSMSKHTRRGMCVSAHMDHHTTGVELQRQVVDPSTSTQAVLFTWLTISTVHVSL